MKKILTGLQPTGEITLGNYIGAIKQIVELQEIYDSYIFIADLHSITVPQDPKVLKENIKKLIALYIACGVDPNKNTIYVQSENEYHTNISWLLECNTYFGELSRMTQFKDKSKKNQNFTTGLFTYPVLMAADILTYDVDYVPVGIDQKQHVELARDIGERLNKKFGQTFKLPEPFISNSGTKIMDLIDPYHKMSKSSETQKGVIRLLDAPEVIRKKIMSAVTDSDSKIKYDMEEKPGISNLLNIYSSLSTKSISSIEKEYESSNYGDFKKAVADIVVDKISSIQEKYYKLINSDELDKILNNGISITREIAKRKYENMKSKMGLERMK